LLKIQVLGAGCPKCEQTITIIQEVLSARGTDARVEKVTAIGEIAKLGVWVTPAVVVDGQVKCTGKVPGKAEIEAWLRD
jgi:small redox-active disulfide protein 2